MSRRKMTAGATSQTALIFIQDTSSTTGGGLGSLVYNSAGLTAKYRREGESSWTTITLATATVGTFTSGGFVADSSGVTGTYEIGVPNAVIASGAKWAAMVLYGATNMLPVLIEFELDVVNYQSSTAFITGVNSLAPPSNWNLHSIDSNGRVDVIKIAGTSQTGRDIGGSLIILANTAQAGGGSTITLNAGASATDNLYRDNWIVITGGTGAGQSREISGYVGSTKVATVSKAWITNPDNTSTFAIVPAAAVENVVNTNSLTAAILAAGDMDGKTVEEAIRMIHAILVGQRAAVTTNSPVHKNAAGTKTRVTRNTDGSGNDQAAPTLDYTP